MKTIKIKHLLSEIDSEREIKSINSISELGKLENVIYEQVINLPFNGFPPIESCEDPQRVSMEFFDKKKVEELGGPALTPGHYGCYKSHIDNIFSLENNKDIIYLVFECDAVLNVKPNIFIEKVYEAYKICLKYNYIIFSFGKPFGNLFSVKKYIEPFGISFNEKDHYKSDALYESHSYMILGSNVNLIKKISKDTKWDVFDFWVTYGLLIKIRQNDRFSKYGFVGYFKDELCHQTYGKSIISKCNTGKYEG